MIRQLHLGNIANVAYGYCKLLRQYGHDASVLCYDLDHVLSQPEWMDTDIDPVAVNEECLDGCDERLKTYSPPEWYQRIKSVDHFITGSTLPSELVLSREWSEALIRFSRRYGSRWTVTEEDINSYKPLVDALAVHFFPRYDVIFGYAYAAVPPLLSLVKPFVPVEIGTMREIPFEDSALGRLLALAYRVAPHVVITNPDVRSAALELGLESFSFVPHPVDEELWRPLPPDEKMDLHGQYQADHLLFAPARQNWSVKGNDKYLAAFAELLKRGLNARLIVAAWGQEVARSKAFTRELGIEEEVVWLDPMPEMALVRYYNACDLVLDQFGTCHTFGLIAPKAMACGTPVMLSYDPGIHEWCFEKQPPVIQANDTKAIYESMWHYLTHQDSRRDLSARCREWVLAYHSKSVIVEKIEAILASIDNGKKSTVPLYDSLKQKRLELTYESAFSDAYDQKYHGSIVYQAMDEKLVAVLKEHIDIAGLKNPHVLDLGCGPGSLTAKLAAVPGIRLKGVDLSPAMIHQAKARFPEVDFFVDDMESLSFEDDAFDVVFCSGVLHHLPRLDLALQEIRRILKTNGILVLREPNADNFASRFPEVAFAGLCLRHYLLQSMATPPLYEPEAHRYHRAFDFLNLAEELGRFFRVIDFHTDMKTSYFFDMLHDAGMQGDVERLEEALVGQPGLNVVFVAKKAVMPGVDASVMETLQRTKSLSKIDPAYFLYFYEFAGSIFAQYRAGFYEDLTNVESLGLDGFLRHQMKSKDILISGDDAEYCHEQASLYSKSLGGYRPGQPDTTHRHGIWSRAAALLRHLFSPRRSGKRFDVKSLDALNPSDRAHYDIGLFYVDKQIPLGKLVELLECVKDYGFICIKAKEGSSLIDVKKEHIDYLNQLTVLKYLRPPLGFRSLIYLTRYLYSPKDFYKALFVALEKERGKYSLDQLPLIDQVLANSKNEWAFRSGEYGHLEQTPLPSLIGEWLTSGDQVLATHDLEGCRDS